MRLLWIIALVLFTTFRHEGSHALATLWTGGSISAMRLFPGYDAELGFYFGYVMREGGIDWLILAAPFIVAVLSAFAAFLIIKNFRLSRNLYDGLFWLGLISPLVDLIYNYQGGFWRETTDVARLLQLTDPIAVHFYFTFSILGIVLLIRCLPQRSQ